MLHLSLTALEIWHRLEHETLSDKALCENTKEVDPGGRMPENNQAKHKGDMTVSEAGHKGGAKGGNKVRRLILEGEQLERDWL